MRILHLAPFLQGGAGRVIVDLAVAQREAGHEVGLVASCSAPVGYGNYPAYLDELRTAGVGVTLVDSMFERRPSANLAVVHALNGLYPERRAPDVIHTHAAVPSLVALLFAGARRIRPQIVQTMHGWGVAKSEEHVAADVATLNLVDCVAVPSLASRDTLVRLGVGPDRIQHIPYGVTDRVAPPDADDRATVREMQRQRENGALVVAAVGTLGARKRQTLLVEAVARMSAPSFAVIVGDGDDTEVRRTVAATRTEERVWVHGYSAAARWIAREADVMVLPSESEGQPLSVLQAFADRTLTVVSDIPELTELVEDGRTGFTAASGSSEALASVLDHVAVLSPRARAEIVTTAAGRYEATFALPAMAERYFRCYRSRTEAGRSRRMTSDRSAA